MTAWIVGLLTAAVIGAGALLGARLGGRRTGSGVGGFVLAALLASLVASVGFRAGWRQPFGLLTPLMAGATVGMIGWFALARGLARVFRAAPDASPGRGERGVGLAIGAVCGVMAAGVLWILGTLAEGLWAGSHSPAACAAHAGDGGGAPESRGWTHALVKTANRGFVTHLPVLGPLGDEAEASIYILNASPEVRQRIATERDWEPLTKLESYRALRDDADVSRDMDALRAGNVLAIYRLRRARCAGNAAGVAPDSARERDRGVGARWGPPQALARS